MLPVCERHNDGVLPPLLLIPGPAVSSAIRGHVRPIARMVEGLGKTMEVEELG